ncbi:MAG: type II secretion system protein [Wenzhouxiangellaceae bacterium]|nr:type II secretion system protein [Wenzhouxiangellaceae bacterium]
MNIQLPTQRQGGFTLIELVIVIVILGILAAVAIPRFVDLSDEASQAATEGVAGALASAAAINFAACQVDDQDCQPVSACADIPALLQQGGVPDGYTVGGTLPDCTVTGTNDEEVPFQGIAATDPTP